MPGTKVIISKRAEKDLKKIPKHISDNLDDWVWDVETLGIRKVRECPGFHDEPLKGKRKGQRSIKLSRSYRAIYVVRTERTVEFIRVEEVNKHAY